MKNKDKKLTSVKVNNTLYSDAKQTFIKKNITFQELVNMTLYLFSHNEPYRDEIIEKIKNDKIEVTGSIYGD